MYDVRSLIIKGVAYESKVPFQNQGGVYLYTYIYYSKLKGVTVEELKAPSRRDVLAQLPPQMTFLSMLRSRIPCIYDWIIVWVNSQLGSIL